jgi:hypothetical protein
VPRRLTTPRSNVMASGGVDGVPRHRAVVIRRSDSAARHRHVIDGCRCHSRGAGHGECLTASGRPPSGRSHNADPLQPVLARGNDDEAGQNRTVWTDRGAVSVL